MQAIKILILALCGLGLLLGPVQSFGGKPSKNGSLKSIPKTYLKVPASKQQPSKSSYSKNRSLDSKRVDKNFSVSRPKPGVSSNLSSVNTPAGKVAVATPQNQPQRTLRRGSVSMVSITATRGRRSSDVSSRSYSSGGSVSSGSTISSKNSTAASEVQPRLQRGQAGNPNSTALKPSNPT